MIKVLIIEDDPLMRRLYQKIFTFEKCEVEVAEDGEGGLEMAASVNPSIILCDIMMPKMNGLQVLDRLKADPVLQKIPVIMLTNLAGQQDAETALAKGAVKYIIKSEHDPKEVADMVTEILANNTIAATSAAQPAPVVVTDPAQQPATTPVVSQPVQPPVVQPTPTPVVIAPQPTTPTLTQPIAAPNIPLTNSSDTNPTA